MEDGGSAFPGWLRDPGLRYGIPSGFTRLWLLIGVNHGGRQGVCEWNPFGIHLCPRVPSLVPTSRLPDWRTGEPANRPTGEPANWRTGELANRPTGEPANWRTGEPANRPTGEPANQRTGRLGDWQTAQGSCVWLWLRCSKPFNVNQPGYSVLGANRPKRTQNTIDRISHSC